MRTKPTPFLDTRTEHKLAHDYYQFVQTDTPFWAIKEETLYLMLRQQINHFRIPASKSHDLKEHVFYFRISVLPGSNVVQYSYIGHDLAIDV